MSNAYDLMEHGAAQEQQPQGGFDKESWAQRKRQEREGVFALADETALRLNADAGARKGYAATMAALPTHSATNVLLVYAQRPGAQRLGDSAFWSQNGASIKKGERGISILEPGREYVREDGSIGNFYDVKKVFDVSQPTARERLGRRNDPSDVLAALVMRSPVAIEPQDAPVEGSVKYDSARDCILVERGLGDKQLLDGLLIEQAHASTSRRRCSPPTWSPSASAWRGPISTSRPLPGMMPTQEMFAMRSTMREAHRWTWRPASGRRWRKAATAMK